MKRGLTIASVVAILAGVPAVYAGASALGVQLPQIVTRATLERSQAEQDALFQELAGTSYEYLLQQAQERYWFLQRELQKFLDAGQQPPSSLVREIHDLERRIEWLKRKVGG